MKDLITKIVVAETKAELLKKFIEDIDSLPDSVQDEYGFRRKRVNYSKMLIAEMTKLSEAARCIQNQYPPEDE
jgi:hypothetical protein